MSKLSQVEHALKQLEKRAAPQTGKPIKIEPEPDQLSSLPVVSARRVAVLAMIEHQLLFGGTRANGPYPSCGMDDEAASLLRHRILKTPEFEAVEKAIAADPSVGPQVFGAEGWRRVAFVFGRGKAPKPPRVQLEATDLAQWKRDRWQRFLESPEGVAAVESGRLWPARVSSAEASNPDTSNAEGGV